MVWELLTGLAVVLALVVLLAVPIARYLYRGPCPRCGGAIERGQPDCVRCRSCTIGFGPRA